MPIKFVFTLLLMAFCIQVDAQYRNSLQDYYYKKVITSGRFGKRLSLSVGKHFMSGNATLDYKGWNPATTTALNTTLEKNIKPRRNYVASIGSYFPITIVSDNSMLVVNTELMAGMATLGYDSVQFLGNNHMEGHAANKIGALLSLEYRMGGDVTLTKADVTLLTIGAGFNPSIVTSTNYDVIIPYKFIPFIKAEAGFFAGIALKVRAIMYFGNSNFVENEAFDVSGPGINDHLITTMSGTNGFDLGIVVMPFSVTWNSRRW